MAAAASFALARPALLDLVIDTSAVVAVMANEPVAGDVVSALKSSAGPGISAGTLLELSMVVEARMGEGTAQQVRALLDAADVVTLPVDETILEAGLEAWTLFGQGRNPARLNFGDCFAYATA